MRPYKITAGQKIARQRLAALVFVVRGLKEFGEPTRKVLIIGEAAPELRARIYDAYYLIRDYTVASGSFLGAAICGTLGTVWFWRFICRWR